MQVPSTFYPDIEMEFYLQIASSAPISFDGDVSRHHQLHVSETERPVPCTLLLNMDIATIGEAGSEERGKFIQELQDEIAALSMTRSALIQTKVTKLF